MEEEEEPLLPGPRESHLSNPLPCSEIEEAFVESTSNALHDVVEEPLHWSSKSKKKTGLHRARTAPAMAVMRDLASSSSSSSSPKPNFDSSGSTLKHTFTLLLIYLALGTLVYSMNPRGFSGIATHPAVDALYFCIVTLCTIGYGDIAPLTPATKAFSCIFVLLGFGFIDLLLSDAVSYVLNVQEGMILASARDGATAANYIFDAKKGRMRIRLKVGLAVGVVILCIGAGMLALYLLERLDWMDSLYLSVMSVTTVGYGDRAFKTLPGRLFASGWLLVSTLAVARAFLILAEARIDKRHRRTVKWVLHRDLTAEDLVAADLNCNGFISKSEYVIYKLKEMGKIGERDILQISNRFNKMDPNNTGKITLPDLLNSNR